MATSMGLPTIEEMHGQRQGGRCEEGIIASIGLLSIVVMVLLGAAISRDS